MQNGIVKEIELENYVCGVLAGEISPYWPLEAVKAMAVCARTFVVNKMLRNYHNHYHLTDQVFDQVYNPNFWQHEIFWRAVQETRGEVLTYQGELAMVYFCASSGGYTASAASVWGNQIPYLKALPDPYSQENPYSYWSLTLKSVDFLKALGLFGKLKNVEIADRDESYRVKVLKVTLLSGDFFFSGQKLREALGFNRLRSTLFEVSMKDNEVTFTGRGWGHGVGLSQWGSKKMAEEGFTYEQILTFYFPGTILGEIATKK